jgi:hypothetical protein
MSYIGSNPQTQSFIAGTDYFNGTGSATAFTLSRSVVSVNDIQATVNNVVQVPNDAYTVSGTTITFTSAPSAGTSNIYVRYLSTTTQSITPSQNTVSYSTLNSDNQSKLGISFKNRIINGAMVINQRGFSGTVSGDPVYTLDRWYFTESQNSKFTISQNAGSVTPPVGFVNYLGATVASAVTIGASDYFALAQAIEGFNVADLNFGSANAKTVTISFWVYSSLTGTFGASLLNGAESRSYPFTYTISSANTWTQITQTIAGDTTGTWATGNTAGMKLFFGLGCGATYSKTAGSWQAGTAYSATGATSVVGTNGATFYLTGVQLEVGTQATTFDYRSYGTELYLCYRYFQYINLPNSTADSYFANFLAYSSTDVRTILRYQVTMRSAPSITFSGLVTVFNSVRGQSFSAYNYDLTGPNSTLIYNASTATGYTTGNAYLSAATAGTNSSFSISAEL